MQLLQRHSEFYFHLTEGKNDHHSFFFFAFSYTISHKKMKLLIKTYVNFVCVCLFVDGHLLST